MGNLIDNTSFIPARLGQAFEILLGPVANVASARVKATGKIGYKNPENACLPPSPKGAAGMVKSFL